MHKQQVLSAGYDDVARTTIFTGRPMNVRKTQYVQEWETKRVQEKEELLSKGLIPHDVELQAHPEKSVQGMTWLMGRVAGSIQDIKPAKEIVDELVTTAAKSIQASNGLMVNAKAKL
jgi:NAD(P)H-dependent flavin oxidoreductase YrpB (nitropropane dioxygenase family)